MNETMADGDAFNALMTRVRAGDEGAASELVGRYEGMLLRAVRHRLGPKLRDALDTVDVAQSVHRSLLIGVRAERFAIVRFEDLIGLAMTMVRRKVARHWRKVKGRAPTVALGPTGDDQGAWQDDLASPEAPPEAHLAGQELLETALADLNEADRQLIRLKLDGHSTADAAELLGVEAKTLRVRLVRLRARLREKGVLEDWL